MQFSWVYIYHDWVLFGGRRRINGSGIQEGKGLRLWGGERVGVCIIELVDTKITARIDCALSNSLRQCRNKTI